MSADEYIPDQYVPEPAPQTEMSGKLSYEENVLVGVLLTRSLHELERAIEKHGREPWGRHEFYGILKEEIDEVWDDIKNDESIEDIYTEVAQVIAVCLRYFMTGDRYTGHYIPSIN